MSDRGMVKWQPFSAVVPSNKMIKDVLDRKNRISKPILSEDQIQILQDKMIEAYNNQEDIEIKYYKDGRYYIRQGKITNIDENKHRLAINKDFWIFFSQIIDFL